MPDERDIAISNELCDQRLVAHSERLSLLEKDVSQLRGEVIELRTIQGSIRDGQEKMHDENRQDHQKIFNLLREVSQKLAYREGRFTGMRRTWTDIRLWLGVGVGMVGGFVTYVFHTSHNLMHAIKAFLLAFVGK